ncbi:MAG: regulatory protein GemA [Actinomycetota bacterium]|nr:regulatory protein GemA [Actinomycetota bacterium]
MSAHSSQSRRAALAAIHVAKRALELDDDAYRDLIERVSATKGRPVRSAGNLSTLQITAVLDEFKRLGGLRTSPKTKGKPANFNSIAMPEMITKVEALLADMKLPWSYADSIAKRQFGIERVAWCRTRDQLRAIIAALDVEQEKRALLGYVERTCKRVGLTLEQLESRYDLGRIKGWRRNRKALKLIGETLANEFPEPEAP